MGDPRVTTNRPVPARPVPRPVGVGARTAVVKKVTKPRSVNTRPVTRRGLGWPFNPPSVLRKATRPTTKTSTLSVSALIKELDDPYPWRREAAAKALGNSRSAAAIPKLIELTDDRYEIVRLQAFNALIKLYKAGVVTSQMKQLLRLGLQSRSAAVRSRSAIALGIFNDRGSMTTIRGLLKSDKSCLVRSGAAMAARYLKDSAAVPLLVATIRYAVNTSSPGAYPTHERWTIVEVAAALKKLGKIDEVKKFVAKLVRNLRHRKWQTRARAAWGLAFLKGYYKAGPVGRALLKQLKREKRFEVKKKIVTALGNIGYKRAIPTLLKIARRGAQKSKVIRVSRSKAIHINWLEEAWFIHGVMQSLGELGVRSSIPFLMGIVKKPTNGIDWKCKQLSGAINALGWLKVKSAIPMIAKRLTGNNGCTVNVDEEAIYTLGAVGDARAVKALVYTVANYSKRQVRMDAAVALYKILKRGGLKPAERRKIQTALRLYRRILLNKRALRRMAK